MKNFSDILFQNLPEFADARLFWEQDLAVNENETKLPYSFYNTGVYESASIQLQVKEVLYHKLLKVSKRNTDALMVLMMSSMRVLLFNYTEQKSLEIGVPSTIVSSEGEWEQAQQLLPVSLALSEELSFRQLLALEKEKLNQVYRYQYFPIQKTDNYRRPRIAIVWSDLTFSADASDINFIFEEKNDLCTLKISYNGALFSKEWVSVWAKKYLYTVEKLLDNSEVPLSDIDLLSEDEKNKIVFEINNTSRNYLQEPNLKKLFERNVVNVPDELALSFGDTSYTYRELNALADRFAEYLISNGVQKGERVGLFMKKNDLTIAGMLGVLKAGAAYVAISPDYPMDRIKFILQDAGIRIVLSSKNHIKVLNKLQWESETFQTFLCMDSVNIYSEKEEITQRNEFNDQKLWEYIGEKADDEIEGGGWQSSFTGFNFSKEEMGEYRENVFKKLKPFVNSETRILEIGCASGITMFGLAPHCGFYYGTDLSGVIIQKNQKEAENRGLTNIKLRRLSASDVDQLEEHEFDIVIINSVAQCFDGHNYFRDVLRKAISLLKNKGLVFLGDLMDEDKREELLTALNKFKEEDVDGKYKVKTNFDQEMFYSRNFLEDLRFEMHEVSEVESTNKFYTIENELSIYRYDSILKINKSRSIIKPIKHKHQHSMSDVPLVGKTQVDISPDDLAYILYTSGSTGKPKGVEIRHKSVIRLFGDTNYLNVTAADRIMNTVPMEFDPSVFEIWMAFSYARPLYVVNTDLLLRAQDLKQYILENKITQTVIVTALFASLTEEDPSVFDGLKHVFIGGEALPAKQLNKLRSYNATINITNLYGPTENTVISTYQPIYTHYIRPVPIGKPISDSKVYILNNKLKLVLPGGEGELYLAGDGLAKGYLNRPDLTAQSFIENPYIPGELIYKTGDLVRLNEYDEIEFLGRKDSQVKIRGFRIELSEIENCITGIKGIKGAKVIVKGAQEDRWLYAYVTATAKIREDELLNILAKRLPAYMLPSAVIQLDEFPLTTNNKVDVSKLPLPFVTQSSQQDAPENDIELLLMDLWKDVLGIQKIGLDDNFFSLGGHSLLAMKVLNRLSKNYELKLTHIFEYPTIRSLAPNLIYKKDNLIGLLNKIENVPLPAKLAVERKAKLQQYIANIEGENLVLPSEAYVMKDVLITGSTGFLGIHVLRELLLQTSAVAHVLIRADSKEKAFKRINEKFQYYFHENLTDKYPGRVQVVVGDLSESLLGLTKEDFDKLSYKVDTILNAAANVKHYGQREDYRMNDEGVRTLVQLASCGIRKRIQHVSTVGVSFGNYALFTEYDKAIKINDENSTYYLETKLEAEKILEEAKLNGIECNNFRIGNLVLNSETGKFQENSENSAFYMVMHSFIRLGILPEMTIKFFDFSFVDVTAKGIISAMKEKNIVNQNLHLFSHHVYSMIDLYEGLIKDNFPGVSLVSLEEFRAQICEKYEDPELRTYIDHILIHIRLLQLKEGNMTAISMRTKKMMEKLTVFWNPINELVCSSIVKRIKEIDAGIRH